MFALGIGYHVSNGTPYRQDLLDVVKEFWKEPAICKVVTQQAAQPSSRWFSSPPKTASCFAQTRRRS
jgi:hypothetical protein